jgi:DNA-binding GntR family transcriptional regulator
MSARGSDPGFSTLPPTSRRHHVAESLRNAIVSGRLAPGDRLTETDLAERLGTSRAPVREALRQLEYEGLVANRPYCASEVLGISQEEIEQVLVPIRLTLERFAFRKALPLLTDDHFAALDRRVISMRHAAEDGDADALADADVHFHELVIVASTQEHCLQLWRAIEPRVRAHFRRDAPAHALPTAVPDQHRQLLEVLRSRDEPAVLEALDRHILEFLVIDG